MQEHCHQSEEGGQLRNPLHILMKFLSSKGTCHEIF
jgi:hypothetical protein